MVNGKLLPIAKPDPYVGVLVVVPKSTRERWTESAKAAGVELSEWVTARVERPEAA